jgi:hypothetical protein
MRPMHETEIEEAKERVVTAHRDPSDFSFEVAFMEPDQDGGGMFTVRYEVTVTNSATDKASTYIGGIGMDWVTAFEEELGEGAFD